MPRNNIKAKISIVIVVVILVIISGISLSQIDSENYLKVTITPVPGANMPGCEEAVDGCFTPNHAVVDVGSTVIISNTSDIVHTWTSGDYNHLDSAGLVFDSHLILPNRTYEWMPKTSGEYPYFCSVYPWMTGLITVR